MLPSLICWHLINGLQKYIISINVHSMKLTLASALTAHRACEKCWVVILQISYHLCNGFQTALISSRWTMQSGASCRSTSTTRESVTLTTSLSNSWSNGPSRFDHTSPVLQLHSGMHVCMRVWRRTIPEILNTFYDNWWNDHTASLEITERVVHVVTETCIFDVQLKHVVIKYDL